jgi:hypothetical protein
VAGDRLDIMVGWVKYSVVGIYELLVLAYAMFALLSDVFYHIVIVENEMKTVLVYFTVHDHSNSTVQTWVFDKTL